MCCSYCLTFVFPIVAVVISITEIQNPLWEEEFRPPDVSGIIILVGSVDRDQTVQGNSCRPLHKKYAIHTVTEITLHVKKKIIK